MINANRIAIYLPSLSGGGAERVTVTLANNFVDRGYIVDLILASAKGPYLSEVSSSVRIVNLNTRRSWLLLLTLISYLLKNKPIALLSAMGHANVMSVLARQLSRVDTKVFVSERNTFSISSKHANQWKNRFLIPILMAWTYPKADGIIAVSNGVADDLASSLKISRAKINVVYNPVVTNLLVNKSHMTPNHRWLMSHHAPVIVGIGRLVKQKNFPMLIRAFALLREKVDARLIILGDGPMRIELMGIIKDLNLSADVDLPGFEENPFAILRHSDLFVLSSNWEGLPNALIQAMACGTPVVSTNCPSGPVEILEDGKWGRLVPIGDELALAQAMEATLADINPPSVTKRAADFGVDQGVNGYLDILFAKTQYPH